VDEHGNGRFLGDLGESCVIGIGDPRQRLMTIAAVRLRQVFRKLGISSRVELARIVVGQAQQPEAHEPG